MSKKMMFRGKAVLHYDEESVILRCENNRVIEESITPREYQELIRLEAESNV